MNGRNERRDQEIGPEEEFALSGSDKTLSYNFCWIKGKRWTMEDSHLAIKLGNIWVFAIFDGHGGKEASEILPDIIQRVLKDKIINFVANSNIPKSMKNCKSNLEKITKATDILTAEQSKSILLEVFEETDKKLYHRLKIYDIKNVGATAALVLVHKNFITTAHCGDSRIHLYENGGQEILHSTKDQKPNDPIEKSRIENNGGTVVINRVQGYACGTTSIFVVGCGFPTWVDFFDVGGISNFPNLVGCGWVSWVFEGFCGFL